MTLPMSEQIQAAAAETSNNIARYLAENTPERAQSTQMQMYDEQFEKQDAARGAEEFNSAFTK